MKYYYYLFYKLYKLFEEEEFHWMREWRVYGLILILNIFLLYSLSFYYNVFIDKNFHLSKTIWILIMIIISVFNFIYFHSKDQWKKYIKEFDKWPKKKNQRGTVIVYGIILLIIVNIIYSIYLYYQT